ncbi:MAG: glyoxalase [Polyangiales bacterium]
MSRMIFVNLPVRDLPKTRAFYGALGFGFNEHFSDDTAACLVISETIFAMLLTHDKFKQFTKRAIMDTSTHVEVLNALSCESRDEVDRLMSAALAAGGEEARDAEDMGFMYHRAFNDLDGHTWELMWMDPAAIPG